MAADRLLTADKRVAVESELIGGECAYWACIPSKAVLRPPEAVAAAHRIPGTSGAGPEWAAVREYRDDMIRHLDDNAQVDGYQRRGAVVIKGNARITGPGRVGVAGRALTADHVIIATGSEPHVPSIDGLDLVQVWTNRETFTVTDLPERAVVIGGSAVILQRVG